MTAGAFSYFTTLRPFAVVAGVDREVDWTVPMAATDIMASMQPASEKVMSERRENDEEGSAW